MSDRPISPLTAVVDALMLARARAEEYRALLHKSEANTRSVLIDPLLRVLGWDTTRPDRVEIERREKWNGQDVCADYVLLDTAGVIVAVVEAKLLDDKLANYDQMTQYRGA